MTDHEKSAMSVQELEELLQLGLLPPTDAVVVEITPWRKAVNRVLIGLALNTVTFHFLNLDYILPGIGILLMILGFRALRTENRGFRLCWFVTLFRTADFILWTVLSTTIWRTAFSETVPALVLNLCNLLVPFVLALGLRDGFRAVQRKAGVPVKTKGITALILWYLAVCALGLLQYNGLILSGILVLAFVFIIRSLYRLSFALDEAGYVIRPAPRRCSDRAMVLVLLAFTAAGMAVGYLFFDKYPMHWAETVRTERQDLTEIRENLRDLGFPDVVLQDLTEADLEACAGAQYVYTVQKDHPVNDGRQVTTVTEGSTVIDTVYDAKELRITSAAVLLAGEPEEWRLFHHFEWVEDPGFFGTDALQFWPVDYGSLSMGWRLTGDYTGQVLYDADGKTYVSPYYSLGSVIKETEGFFGGSYVATDSFAAFSFPDGKDRCRGYVTYPATKVMDGCILSSNLNFIHQQSKWRFPVQSALEFGQPSVFYSDKNYIALQDDILLQP